MLMSRPRIPEFSLKKNLPMPWRQVFFALASRGKKKIRGSLSDLFGFFRIVLLHLTCHYVSALKTELVSSLFSAAWFLFAFPKLVETCNFLPELPGFHWCFTMFYPCFTMQCSGCHRLSSRNSCASRMEPWLRLKMWRSLRGAEIWWEPYPSIHRMETCGSPWRRHIIGLA